MAWAIGLIAVVMTVVLRSPAAGIISMIPNVFPIVVVFGALGWLGINVDIGIMMTASVALGVAVDDTVHFLTWFRRGISRGAQSLGCHDARLRAVRPGDDPNDDYCRSRSGCIRLEHVYAHGRNSAT